MADVSSNYIIFPIFIIVLSFLSLIFVLRRRNQRRNFILQGGGGPNNNGHWPADRSGGGPGLMYRMRDRGAGAPGTRRGVDSTEGLNELGEAPPPYDGKREPGPMGGPPPGPPPPPSAYPPMAGDLEAGLPGYNYPAAPARAATRD